MFPLSLAGILAKRGVPKERQPEIERLVAEQITSSAPVAAAIDAALASVDAEWARAVKDLAAHDAAEKKALLEDAEEKRVAEAAVRKIEEQYLPAVQRLNLARHKSSGIHHHWQGLRAKILARAEKFAPPRIVATAEELESRWTAQMRAFLDIPLADMDAVRTRNSEVRAVVRRIRELAASCPPVKLLDRLAALSVDAEELIGKPALMVKVAAPESKPTGWDILNERRYEAAGR